MKWPVYLCMSNLFIALAITTGETALASTAVLLALGGAVSALLAVIREK